MASTPGPWLQLVFLCAVLWASGSWTAQAKTKHRSLLVNNAKPADQSVFERGLVTEHMNYRNVLIEHSRHWHNTSHRHFKGNVLGYVTPWNSKGYDIAVKFRDKFTHISPVWYQLKGQRTGPELHGGDGVDSTWAKRLKEGDTTVKLVPRFMIEGPNVRDLVANDGFEARTIELLVSECTSQGYDGLVLEAWSSWIPSGLLDSPALREKALGFIRRLASALSSQDPPLETLLVISPPGTGGEPQHVFTANDVTTLAPYLAGFSLMTYDFSNPYSPGPNAPLNWVQACLMYLLPHIKPKHIEAYRDHHYSRELRSVEVAPEEDEIAPKILLGLNFYGNKFEKPRGGGPIVGHEYLELVDKHRPALKWDETSKEHHFTVKTDTGTKYEVFYPSLKSVAHRLDEARAWGTGISIWEIGQGLDFFYDLL